MKITDRLIGDHKTFRKMIADLEAMQKEDPARQDVNKLIRVTELFKDHLMLHAWFEDNFYYPAISKEIERFAGTVITPVYMSHLDHEHKTIDGYLDRLEADVKSVPIIKTWPQVFALFRHGLEAHMKSEEEELFPESERIFGSERLVQLSEEIERHRTEAPKVRLYVRG